MSDIVYRLDDELNTMARSLPADRQMLEDAKAEIVRLRRNIKTETTIAEGMLARAQAAESALAAKDAALREATEALRRYRYAVAFASADAWDGGSDIRGRFSWAREADPVVLTDNEVAEIGKEFHARAALKQETAANG